MPRGKGKGPFAIDDNNVNFLCCQKWVASLPMLLFALDDGMIIVVNGTHFY